MSKPLHVAAAGESEHVGPEPGEGEEHRQEEHQHELTDLTVPGAHEARILMEQQAGRETAEDREDPEPVGANARDETSGR